MPKMSTSFSDVALKTWAVKSFANEHVVSLKHDNCINTINITQYKNVFGKNVTSRTAFQMTNLYQYKVDTGYSMALVDSEYELKFI